MRLWISWHTRHSEGLLERAKDEEGEVFWLVKTSLLVLAWKELGALTISRVLA